MLTHNLTNTLTFTWQIMGLLERTMRRIDRIAVVAPIEHELELALEEAFFRQGEMFISQFKKLKPWFPPEELKEAYIPLNLSPAEVEALWQLVAMGSFSYFEGPMNAAAVKALLAGKSSVIAELNWVGSFQLGFDEALLNQIPALTKMQLHSINATTQKYINTQIRHAMDEGWSYDRTAKAITSRFEEFAIGKPQLHIQSRAHLVAVTETGNMYVEGNMQTARAIQGMGLEIEKFWSTMEDDRVSDGCKANTAVGYIPLNDLFPSGHMQPLRFPGCRCNVHHRRAKGQPAEARKPGPGKKKLRAENGEAETDKAINDVMMQGRPGWGGKPVTQHDSPANLFVQADKSDAKYRLVTELSKRTGLPYEKVDDAIKQWARSSNHDMRSLGFQQAISEEFGVPLSQWQKDKIAWYAERTIGFEDVASFRLRHPDYFPTMPMEDMRALVRAQYEWTQELLAQHGIKELTLYRGYTEELIADYVGLEEGADVILDMNAGSSWSMMIKTSEEFSRATLDEAGYIIQATVPRERILSIARTGWGCLGEFEVVVLGSFEIDMGFVWEVNY